MGNAVTLGLFAGLVLVCVAIVLYSLFGKHRSIFVAIPTFLVMALAIAPQIVNPGGAGLKLQLVIAIGAALGLVRQFQRVGMVDDALDEADQIGRAHV